jgi:hypothetical protein
MLLAENSSANRQNFLRQGDGIGVAALAVKLDYLRVLGLCFRESCLLFARELSLRIGCRNGGSASAESAPSAGAASSAVAEQWSAAHHNTPSRPHGPQVKSARLTNHVQECLPFIVALLETERGRSPPPSRPHTADEAPRSRMPQYLRMFQLQLAGARHGRQRGLDANPRRWRRQS